MAPTYRSVLLLALAACAEGKSAQDLDVDASTPSPIDAADPGVTPDAPADTGQGVIDAPPGEPTADASPSAPDAASPDAAVPPDAEGCTTRDLLQNGAFDDPVRGSFWTEDADRDLITGAAGEVDAQGGAYRLWLGKVNYAADVAYQDVAVPAGTTRLVLAGYRETRTGETSSTIYDRSTLQIRAGTQTLETLARFTNLDATTRWTAFSFPLAEPRAGTTIRVYIDGTNDYGLPTSFFYDSLSLTATVCP